MWNVMGTFATVSVPAAEREDLATYTVIARYAFDELSGKWSVYDSSTTLSRLNDAAGKEWVELDPSTEHLLERIQHYAKESGGAFDPTISPLVQAWGFSGGDVPLHPLTKEQAAPLLAACGYEHLVVSNNSAHLELEGMSVDPGGIAKGLAVDRAYEKIVKQGGRNFMVNLGGNLRCLGVARDKNPWVIGVQNPFDGSDILGTFEVTDGWATATSGNYERFVQIDGKYYAHIIDPRSGMPVEGMAGVTVISRRAVEADALSTAFFVLGVDGTRKALHRFPDSHVLLIEDKRPLKIWVSPGFKARFKPGEGYADAVMDL